MSWDFGGGSGGSQSTGGGSGWDDLTTAPTQGGRAPNTGFRTPAPGESPGGSLGPAGADGASAPLLWLGLGIALGVVAIIVHVVLGGVGSAFVGWFVGGPVVIGLLAVFVTQDTARRADPWYADSSFAPWGRRLLVVLSLVAVALNAWAIADFFARGGSL